MRANGLNLARARRTSLRCITPARGCYRGDGPCGQAGEPSGIADHGRGGPGPHDHSGNISHNQAVAISIASKCKVNANIGASPNASDAAEEVKKLKLAVKYGADTVMDLSTGGVLDEVRTAIIDASRCRSALCPFTKLGERARFDREA